MPPAIDIIGLTFGRLTVVSEGDRNKHRQRTYLCRCQCGSEVVVVGGALRSGRTTSCGCRQREVVGALNIKHGHGNTREDVHPVYRTWLAMRNRCNNPNDKHYADYGARGISVSPDWDDFKNFLADMGEKPGPQYSIDRIDNEKGYYPGNCRWATPLEQAANKRPHANQLPICIDGVTYPSLRQAASATHVCRNTLRNQLDISVKS